ncbi:MAG: hypothetical protein V9G14_04105 [Cypionkella sp.]
MIIGRAVGGVLAVVRYDVTVLAEIEAMMKTFEFGWFASDGQYPERIRSQKSPRWRLFLQLQLPLRIQETR